jgi:hypothetical protein
MHLGQGLDDERKVIDFIKAVRPITPRVIDEGIGCPSAAVHAVAYGRPIGSTHLNELTDFRALFFASNVVRAVGTEHVGLAHSSPPVKQQPSISGNRRLE